MVNEFNRIVGATRAKRIGEAINIRPKINCLSWLTPPHTKPQKTKFFQKKSLLRKKIAFLCFNFAEK